LSGLSRTQVASILGIDLGAITSAEDGERIVSSDELKRLSDIYEVDRSWLAGEGADKIDVHDSRFRMTSGELEKLDPADQDMVLRVLAAMRGTEGND
jgi:transcriptional regulator with XRE-family HTH domain